MELVQSELLDRHTERWVMDNVFVKCNISLSLRKYKKPDRFDVVDLATGEAHTILAKSVNHRATWKACLKDQDIDSGSYSTVKQRVEIYRGCLLHKPKSPYLFIAANDELEKLHDMIVFSAIFRTTEQRYTERRMADPEVRQRVATLLALRENNEGMSKAVGHARKHDEDVMGAIDTAYRGSLDRIEALSTSIDWKEPLPALPEGMSHALAWYQLG